MKELFSTVRSAWTPERAENARHGVHGRLRRRARVRTGLGIGALGLVLVLAGGGVAYFGASDSGGVADRALDLEDGSRIVPLGALSEVRVAEVSERGRVVRLVRGEARFVVAPDRTRPFRVEVGGVSVEALGTTFRVAESGGRVEVAVETGRVRVRWAGGSEELGAGQRSVFPPLPAGAIDLEAAAASGEPVEHPPVPADGEPTARTAAAGAPRIAGVESAPGRRWRALAQRGQFDAAYRAMREAMGTKGVVAVPDEPGALLLAADVARLSHHPAEAVAPLRALVARFPRDARAGLAAFTLGIVLLDGLGRPVEAAQAFAQSRRIDPGGDLAEDALAREVEAHFKAGDTAMARRRALEYAERHPRGRRIKSVRGFGALE